MADIAEPPRHVLVEHVLAGIKQSVEPLFAMQHRSVAELILDDWLGSAAILHWNSGRRTPSQLEAALSLHTVRLADQAGPLVRLLVQVHC